MTARDPLAYEIRRLATLILQTRDQQHEKPRPDPGELALRIASAFRLRPVDVDIALAVLASELDDEFNRLIFLDGRRSELGILGSLVPHVEERLAFADAVGRDAPAVRHKLLRRIEPTGELRTTRRFRTAVTGQPLISSLPPYATLLDAPAPSVEWVVPPAGLLRAMRQATSGTLCLVYGGAGVGKTTWACHAAQQVSDTVVRVDATRAASGPATSSELHELIEDATLAGSAVVVDNASELLTSETRFALVLDELVDTIPAKVFVVVENDNAPIERLASKAIGVVRIEAPGPSHRRRLWGVDENANSMIATLADDLVLTPRQIGNARRLIEAGAEPATAAFEQLPKSHGLTLPDRSTARLESLVLPADVQAEIVELIGAIRARGAVSRAAKSGRGHAITALFDGDSGTGKTYSCEVIASEVGLPLMRVNVATLVDKYVGETEKNLARVFAQAQAQGGILFFDEADALFGTRTDVSRAQDRYANLETNLLLQLMEQFSGVVLLTTNLKKNIDQAFMRRIMFKVYFETPEPPERERLWRTLLPPDMFAGGVDFRRLAGTFELSGGSIRAALLRASYRAAAANGEIQMSDLVECAQLETQGMGRVAHW